MIFYNITRCYGKHVAVFAVAVAAGAIIKYQSFVYGSFVWGMHVRYNKIGILSGENVYIISAGNSILAHRQANSHVPRQLYLSKINLTCIKEQIMHKELGLALTVWKPYANFLKQYETRYVHYRKQCRYRSACF